MKKTRASCLHTMPEETIVEETPVQRCEHMIRPKGDVARPCHKKATESRMVFQAGGGCHPTERHLCSGHARLKVYNHTETKAVVMSKLNMAYESLEQEYKEQARLKQWFDELVQGIGRVGSSLEAVEGGGT